MRGDSGELGAVSRWEERVAERMAVILSAEDEFRDMVTLAGPPLNASPLQHPVEQVDDSIERDPELEQTLLRLDADLTCSYTTRGKDRDLWWEEIEKKAAPYALAFYYEIRRLDSLLRARSPATTDH